MENTDIKFSIITICKNAELEIERTLQSVLFQEYSNFEYIVVDGKSSDQTTKIIEKYAEKYPIHWISECDTGIYNAMNKGIQVSTGDYVLFQNAGDFFCSKYVLKKVSEKINKGINISQEKKKEIYYGYTVLCYNGRKVILDEDRGKKYKMLAGYMPVHQSVFFAGDKIRGRLFNESYRLRSDYDWLMEAQKKGFGFKNINFPVSAYNVDGVSGRGKSRKVMEKETKEIVEKYYPWMRMVYGFYCGIIELIRQKQNY